MDALPLGRGDHRVYAFVGRRAHRQRGGGGEGRRDLNRPADALKEFESTLVAEPNRFRSLYGAARAAEGSGNAARARTFYTNLVSLCGNADTERPELREAKAFLAK